MRCNLRWLGAGFAALLLLVIIVPYLIPLEQYNKQVETIVSEATGYQADIDSVGFSVFPSPQINISKLQISRPHGKLVSLQDSEKSDQLAIEKVTIPLDLVSLIFGKTEISSLKLERVMADQPLLIEFIGSLGSSDNEQTPGDEQKAADKGSSFKLHLVEVTSLKLRLEKGTIIGPYHLHVYPDMETGFSKITLSRNDKAAYMEANKDGEDIRLHIAATNWVNPLGFPVEINSLAASGVISGSKLTLSNIDTKIFDGRLTGRGDLSWNNDWKSSGKIKSKGINLAKALQHLDEKTISGDLDADCKFSLKADQPDTLLDNPVLSCVYQVAEGEFYKADLENAASLGPAKKQKNTSTTPFDELRGKVALNNRNIEITDLNLISATLQVNGAIKVQKYNTVNGRIEVGVKKTASLTSVPLKISGTLDDLKFRPTDDAIAGATVGTVLLGPGLGTAIGVNIGKGINKLFHLFKSDDNEKSGQDNALEE